MNLQLLGVVWTRSIKSQIEEYDSEQNIQDADIRLEIACHLALSNIFVSDQYQIRTKMFGL